MSAFQKPHVLRSQQSLHRVSRVCVFWSQGSGGGISRRRCEVSESTERESVMLMIELSLSGSSSFSISRLNTHKMFSRTCTAFLGRHQNQYCYWEVVLYAIMNIILGKEKYQSKSYLAAVWLRELLNSWGSGVYLTPKILSDWNKAIWNLFLQNTQHSISLMHKVLHFKSCNENIFKSVLKSWWWYFFIF